MNLDRLVKKGEKSVNNWTHNNKMFIILADYKNHWANRKNRIVMMASIPFIHYCQLKLAFKSSRVGSKYLENLLN